MKHTIELTSTYVAIQNNFNGKWSTYPLNQIRRARLTGLINRWHHTIQLFEGAVHITFHYRYPVCPSCKQMRLTNHCNLCVEFNHGNTYFDVGKT